MLQLLQRNFMGTSTDLYHRWFTKTRKHPFAHAGERIGAAVSGGPDSVLMLEFLARMAGEIGFQLAVVHFNHHLRGAESNEDEGFVQSLARRYDVPFLRGEARVAEEARKRRRNIEATAREYRYRFFLGLIRQGKLDKVATAHTLDDQAETVLLHILRGTGTRGLAGIHSNLQNRVVRPFLSLTRAEIEADISQRNLTFRVDSTNLETRFRRNKVRKELLPMLEREYNPEIKRLLSELAARSREDEAFLDQQARERAGAWRLREDGAEKISRAALRNMPPALARRVLRQMLAEVGGGLAGFTHRHIEALYHLALESQSGKRLQLPWGLAARSEFDWLILAKAGSRVSPLEFIYNVVIPGTIWASEISRSVTFKIVGCEDADWRYNGTEWPKLDPLRMPARLVLRNWRQGDRYCPSGSQKPVKVKELFRRHRVPLNQRACWPVLDSEAGIVCARGLPAAAWATAKKECDRVVVIHETPMD
ncbi:MAG: tRNA lysidine(34) synthetase TilS [Acidobacteria bacterium]|nr:MAG: tRNA lysidine(34) synthetase TilS [Acidobacteriota bacterium]